MVTHKLELYYEVEFDDGTKREIPWPEHGVYYFHEQKSLYLVSWLESLIEKEHITAKPLFIRESYRVIECEPWQIIIGV